MELNEYQKRAVSTCMPSCENFGYMFLNLVGEVGEFTSKIAKQIRKGNLKIGCDKYPNCLLHAKNMKREDHNVINDELKKEAGDILWQLSGLCKVMGWKLEDVAQENLAKLAARKEAGTIDGNGDGIYDRKG